MIVNSRGFFSGYVAFSCILAIKIRREKPYFGIELLPANNYMFVGL
jgi:hypothetical protein